MYHLHNYCRACGYAEPSGPPGIKSAPSGEKLIEVFDLGLQSLANDFCREGEEHAGFVPLKVLLCPRCSLAQLSVVVNPSVLYSKYSYVTSNTNTMREHFQKLWQSICDRQSVHENVLEIGSNDGTFLTFAKSSGADSVLGVDPAENLCAIAREQGVSSICGLFNKETAKVVRTSMPIVDVIVARHVFCHIDDWHGFIRALDMVSNRNTLIVIEVPYVMDLLKRVQFDTVYHEHLSYLNIKAVEALLKGTVFKLDNIQHFPIHGGATALYLRRNDYNGNPDDSVAWYLQQEEDQLNRTLWTEFAYKAETSINDLRSQVCRLVNEGKTVCGFGASAKSTVWVNACGFNRSHLKFICDSTPQKQWCCSPGTDIPIVDEGALLRDMPDYAVMFCWNFERECLERQQQWISKGGQFIIPVPSFRIVGK